MKRGNVFNFRRLKWGDPEEKIKLLGEDLASSSPTAGRGLGVLDYALIAFTLVAVLFCAATPI